MESLVYGDPRNCIDTAKVVRHSMEPVIPDGAYCLFTRPVEVLGTDPPSDGP